MMKGILAIIAVTTFQRLNLGNIDLIEECSLPWKPYIVDGTNDGFYSSQVCHSKCEGKAFHTNEGKLICFYKKDVAQKIPNRPLETKRINSTTENCVCGYKLSKHARKSWMSCNFSIPDTSRTLCDGICNGFSVYLFRRRNKKQIVHCEQYPRKEFYEMDGQIGEVRTYRNKSICTCGISNVHLHVHDVHRNEFSNNEIFKECAEPWKGTKFFDIKKVETCELRCHKRCLLGYGVYFQEKAFCFHQSMPLVRRAASQGRSEGVCECGHNKRIYTNDDEGKKTNIEFFSCDPPIFRNDLKPHACIEYCSKLLAYVYRSGSGPWNVRCMSEDDHKSLKPKPLTGKCDVDVHQEDNDKRTYMICRCGLRKKRKSEIPSDPTKLEEMGVIQVPDLWNVKKKRSQRSYQKSHTDIKNPAA